MRSAFLLCALTVALSTLAAAQSGLTGAWTISVNTPNGSRDADMALKVDGETLTGSMSGPQGEVPFTGTAKDNTFKLSFDVQTPNGTFTINMSGEVDGDSMKKRRRIVSSLISSPRRSATALPRWMTKTRLARPITSGSSEEISSTAAPASVRARIML